MFTLNFNTIKKFGTAILIIGLFLLLILQRYCGTPSYIPPKNDTIILKDTTFIHDTIEGKTKWKERKHDTVWMTKVEYKPDTSYPVLLEQYKKLGNEHFTTNTFITNFPLDTLGSATVVTLVRANKLLSSTLSPDIKIPNTTTIITKPSLAKRQVYVGGALMGNPTHPISGIQAGILYKDRKDRILGAHVGFDGELQYSLSSYWKIKFK